MRQTFTTTMPDRVGAFLKASRSIAGAGANITRVSYNKAVDMHILFIEVEGTPDQLSRVERELGAMGYLPDGQRPATVILLEFELEDRPGEVLPVLELIDRFHFNISYISSQENGGACQHFRMGLLVEDEAAVSRFMREASTLCPVRVIHYDHAEKNLDNTAFYLNFAGEVGCRAGLDQQDRRELMVNANQVMQMLDGRDEAPYKTFEYIGKFAAQLDACRGDAYEVRLTEWQGRCGARMRVAEPPAGCNVTVIEKDGEVLFVDAGFACMRQETVAALSTLARHFGSRQRTAIITHADVDHCGLLDLYDDVYMSRKCLQNFEWERAGEPNLRERNPVHAPYVRISKLLSGYRPPMAARLHVAGGSLAPCQSPLERIGTFDFHGLSFEMWEGFGGHVAGETIWVERRERIALTGDVFVNLKGFTAEQAAFNRLAPYLMTSVDTDPRKAAAERQALKSVLGEGEWIVAGAHGMPAVWRL